MEKKSSIIAIGLTIHNTPVEIREKLAIPEVSNLHHACLKYTRTVNASDTHLCLQFRGVLTTKLFDYFRLSGPEPLRNYAHFLTSKRQQCFPLVTEWSCML